MPTKERRRCTELVNINGIREQNIEAHKPIDTGMFFCMTVKKFTNFHWIFKFSLLRQAGKFYGKPDFFFNVRQKNVRVTMALTKYTTTLFLKNLENHF